MATPTVNTTLGQGGQLISGHHPLALRPWRFIVLSTATGRPQTPDLLSSFQMPILSPVNPRAKFPATLRDFMNSHNISHTNLLSTNPKTEKSEVQTYTLHFAPAETSGFNVCPNARNCKAICLNFAGNPVYMQAKQQARIRRTRAFYADTNSFMQTLVASIAHHVTRQPNTEPIAIRLNGTSDICWENVAFSVDRDFERLLQVKFGFAGQFYGLWDNIFDLFRHAERMLNRRLVWFYDYTKLSRDWEKCARLGYHLTFSFDGWDNPTNLRIAKRAIEAGVNVAAAFNLKRKSTLPVYIDASQFSPDWQSRVLNVYDGDLSDFRPNDPIGGNIIGLRFKLPHGTPYTAADKSKFCIA